MQIHVSIFGKIYTILCGFHKFAENFAGCISRCNSCAAVVSDSVEVFVLRMRDIERIDDRSAAQMYLLRFSSKRQQ
jgi:hypothetical protein